MTIVDTAEAARDRLSTREHCRPPIIAKFQINIYFFQKKIVLSEYFLLPTEITEY